MLIPGNDDALRAIRLFASKVADAVIAGQGMRAARGSDASTDKPAEPRPRARAASVSATSISTAPAAPTPS